MHGKWICVISQSLSAGVVNSLNDFSPLEWDEPWIPYSQTLASIRISLGHEQTCAKQELEIARNTHHRFCGHLTRYVAATFTNASALSYIRRSDRTCRHLHLQESAYLPCMPAFTAGRICSVFPPPIATILLSPSRYYSYTGH